MRSQDTESKIYRRSFFAAKLALASLTITACAQEASKSTSAVENETSIVQTVGDCEPFVVYAQNRFLPPGAIGRSEPDINSDQVASFSFNQQLTAIGYVEGQEPAYPDNPESIDGSHWLIVRTMGRLAYVNDAAVREKKTEQDPTGGLSEDLGPIVDLKPECLVIED